MSASFIVDASVGFAWVYQGQATPETDRLLNDVAAGATVVVPALWFLEMSNVLLVAQRRHRLTAELWGGRNVAPIKGRRVRDRRS